MKKLYTILLITAAGFILPHSGYAQERVSDVRVVVLDVSRQKDSIQADLDIVITGRTVARREQLRLYPAIKYGANETVFAPMAVNGKVKDKLLARSRVLAGYDNSLYASVRTGGRNFSKTVRYSGRVKAEPWMENAHVVLIQEVSNCRGDYRRTALEVIAPRIRNMEKPVLDAVYSPHVPFIQPPHEAVKSRAASGEANIVYTSGNAEIKPSLGDNYAELSKIQRSIDEVRNLPGAQIKAVSISSYASPEGGWESNQRLSERRAASLTEWVRLNTSLHGTDLSARGYGEDWMRFGEMMEKDRGLGYADREYVLSVMNSYESPDAKESRLRRHNGGQTFRYLLNNVFPPLRRSEYRIEYTLPEYSLERSREIYRTHPQSLSLKELYALANEHAPGSPEFVGIIDHAAKLFPDEKIARLNMAAANLSSGNTDRAREILAGMENEPDAQIYFGILAAKGNDLDAAEVCFRKALAAGNPDAAGQLEYLAGYRKKYDAWQSELRQGHSYGKE